MILFLLVLIVLLYGFQEWSRKNALKGVEFQSRITKQLVEPGESFQLVSVLTNRSRRIVPFLRVEETFPKDTEILHGRAKLRTDLTGNVKHHYSTYLMPKSQLERKIGLAIPHRGLYYFRGAQIAGGDFLGLWEERASFVGREEIVVYPKAADMGHLDDAFGGFMGEVSVRRFMMEDPVLTKGIRDYTGREPLNQISWKHSARRGQMQVKEFDYTVEPMVSVLLDTNLAQTQDGRRQLLEQTYSLCRAVCQQLEQKRMAYDFIANTVPQDTFASSGQYLPQGLGGSHFQKILELLGRASYDSAETLEATIDKLILKQNRNRSTILIVPNRSDRHEQLAQKLTAAVGGTLIFLYGEDCQ